MGERDIGMIEPNARLRLNRLNVELNEQLARKIHVLDFPNAPVSLATKIKDAEDERTAADSHTAAS